MNEVDQLRFLLEIHVLTLTSQAKLAPVKKNLHSSTYVAVVAYLPTIALLPCVSIMAVKFTVLQ